MTSALTPGTLVGGDFCVLGPLASGGMGSVHVAEQRSTGKRRALKVMRAPEAHGARAGELRARFEQEAKVGARIASPHVVEVVAAGVDPAGFPFLAMELLEGVDLGARVAASGPQPPDVVAAIFEQLVHAVGAAHDAGVVHRDLKPENVFLARPNHVGVPFTVKVLDFGIAKLLQEVDQKGTTGALGSPLWMAPEQTEAAPITPATDVWALGLLAFHALTGVPFWRAAEAGSLQQLLREILFDPLPPASVRAREKHRDGLLPPGFDELFARALQRSPEHRLSDARAFGAELAALLGRAPPRLTAPALDSLPPARDATSAAAFAPTAVGLQVLTQPSPGVAARSAALPPLSATDGTSVAATKRSAEHPSRPPPPAPRRGALPLVGAFVLGGALIGGAALVAVRGQGRPRELASVASAPVEAPPPSAAPAPPPSALEPPASAAAPASVEAPPSAAPSASAPAAKAKPGPIKEGVLPKDVIESRLRGRIPSMNACIKDEQAANPSFEGGRITTNFWIGTSGAVTSAASQSTDLPPAVVQCVLAQLRSMRFPQPEGGPVNVIFPIRFKAR